MNNSDTYLSKNTAGYGIAAGLAIVCNTLLTWAKESYPPLLAAMKSLGHHWVIHGIVIVGLFIVLGWLLSQRDMRLRGEILAWILVASTVLAGLGLVLWFFFH